MNKIFMKIVADLYYNAPQSIKRTIDCYIQKDNFDKDKFFLKVDKCIKQVDNLHSDKINNIPEIFKDYYEILCKELSNEELKLCNRNMESISIFKKLPTLNGFHLSYASYNSTKNRLVYFSKKHIAHEFVHIASSFYNKGNSTILAGFIAAEPFNYLGIGITEAYTELFASRVFYKDKKPLCYNELVGLIEMIELYFDDPKEMRKLFFECNLIGLIRNLEKYMTLEEAYNLILAIDYLNDTVYKKDVYAIQDFIYEKFKSKCNDLDRLQKMDELYNKLNVKRPKKIRDDKTLIENGNLNEHYDKMWRKYAYNCLSSMGFVAIITGTVLATGCSISYVNYLSNEKKIEDLVDTNTYHYEGDYDSIILKDLDSLSKLCNVDMKCFYVYLVKNGIDYVDINGIYYTLNAGELIFDNYVVSLPNGESFKHDDINFEDTNQYAIETRSYAELKNTKVEVLKEDEQYKLLLHHK